MSSRIITGALTSALFVTLLAAAAAHSQQKPEDLAQQSAESWLALVDSGTYGKSWEQAASIFKGAVTKEDWKTKAGAVRDPLGKLISRKLKSANYTKTLPGAPDGEYVVIQYDTQFEHKDGAIETVTPLLEKDGSWKVSGYFIK